MLQQEHLTVQSDLAALSQVQKWFEAFFIKHTSQLLWSEEKLYCLNLALAEGFTNAVRHAHQELPPTTPIEIDVALWDDRLEIRIWDRGNAFNPDSLQEPEPGTLQEGGYGWFLLRRLAERVVYERSENGGNCLRILCHLCNNKQP